MITGRLLNFHPFSIEFLSISMSLITLKNLTIRFRGPALLDEISCEIEARQRIGLLGRNGSGKTTLMKLLIGQAQPDSGQITIAAGAKIGMLQQDVPSGIDSTVLDIVITGLNEAADLSEWEQDQAAQQMISRMQLDPYAMFDSLSSGMKRRVLLAKSLVSKPDLLLLDEPTNHLDVEAIEWLEGFLGRWNGTLIFVTHDRAFLRKLATRILEIDRGRIFDWQCDYETFLERKEGALEAEEKQNALFDKRLAQEEVWIRQGVKARRTRNMGRVRALEEMREQRRDRRGKVGQVDLKIDSGQRSGQLVADLKNVSFRYGDQIILENFSTTVMRGEKVGIIGSNGAGKSTLLKLMLGKLEPTSGSVRSGTNLQVAYFDQLRQQLDEEKTVEENVGDGYQNITVAGQPRHIIGYLSDFLFSAERARTPVKFLSGGERNRILLAKLFAKPANVIVLDEPTNDLDSETLEMLESRLVEYQGTVLMVSHDRSFLDNVVTSTIVFEESGVNEYDGGYQDWQRQRANRVAEEQRLESESNSKKSGKKSSGSAAANAGGKSDKGVGKQGGDTNQRKLKYTEKIELEKLPSLIEAMEAKISKQHEKMANPGFYKSSGDKITQEQSALSEMQMELQKLFARWEQLEAISH